MKKLLLALVALGLGLNLFAQDVYDLRNEDDLRELRFNTNHEIFQGMDADDFIKYNAHIRFAPKELVSRYIDMQKIEDMFDKEDAAELLLKDVKKATKSVVGAKLISEVKSDSGKLEFDKDNKKLYGGRLYFELGESRNVYGGMNLHTIDVSNIEIPMTSRDQVRELLAEGEVYGIFKSGTIAEIRDVDINNIPLDLKDVDVEIFVKSGKRAENLKARVNAGWETTKIEQ